MASSSSSFTTTDLAEGNPTFTLYANRDGEWYRFFLRQFNILCARVCRVEQVNDPTRQSN